MTIVVAKCVACGTTTEVKAIEIRAGELPMCPKCYSPTYAVEAKS